MRSLALALFVPLVAGCPSGPDDDEVVDVVSAGVISYGDEVVCAEPTAGFDRLRPLGGDPFETEPRVHSEGPCVGVAGSVAAEDIDGDGDPDLVVGQIEAAPILYRNDGGTLVELPPLRWDPDGRQVLGLALIDLDADRLPELVLSGAGFVVAATNQGDFRFGAFRYLFHQPDYPLSCLHSITAGDADGDGDLDLYMPGADVLADRDDRYLIDPTESARDVLLLHQGDLFLRGDLPDSDRIALFGHFTDFDADGDMDLLVPPDRMHITGNWLIDLMVNDGGTFTDRGPEFGAAVPMLGGMGVASADLNGDRELDYCIAEASSVFVCLVSSRFGYIESGLSMGLEVAPWDGEFYNAWSIEFIDLDNDGFLDMPAASGMPERWAPERDAMFRGGPDGFTEVGIDIGFDSLDYHTGIATADFQGDGYREIVVGSRDGRAQYWDNPCGAERWIRVDLRGPVGNPRGLGARVETVLPDRVDLREVSASRGWGQSQSGVHVGVGDLTQVRVRVTWPDRTVQETDVPTNRVITVAHPAAG